MEFNNYNFQQNYPELDNVYNFNSKTLTRNMSKINFVVTHGYCMDGFMSATIVHKYLSSIGTDMDNVTFVNTYYTADHTELIERMRGKYVLICDFSFKKDIFQKMIEAVEDKNILILDHHKTARAELQNIPQEYYVFDMNHSGAFITWTYLFGFHNIPKAVLYIEDNDIWTKKLPYTREFTAYLQTKEFEFEEYDKLYDDTYLANTVFAVGGGMVSLNDKYLKTLNDKAAARFMIIGGRYYFVICIDNAGILHSEIGNYVLLQRPNANFSLVFMHNYHNNTTSVSYRSLDSMSDTTPIAAITGGGGHRNASGSTINHIVCSPPGQSIDQNRCFELLNYVYLSKYTTNQNNYTFIMLNSPTTKKHLAKYLMQERYIGDDGMYKNKSRSEKGLPGFQEGMFCMKSRLNDDTYNEAYDGSIVWHYDGYAKIYIAAIKTLPNILDKDKIKYYVDEMENNDSSDNPDYANNNIMIHELKDNLFVVSFPESYGSLEKFVHNLLSK